MARRRRGSRSRLGTWGSALALSAASQLAAPTVRLAQADDLSTATAAGGLPDHLDGSPDEQAGWQALEDAKWIRARELADKTLARRPDSFQAHYVLGVAMHYGEGDLARSVFHLEKAAELFEHLYGPRPADDTPWRWHEASLRELAFSLNEIDRPADELAALDRYDAVYQPKRVAQRVWPLMKLRRYDESRAAAKLAVASGSYEQKIIARSDLCAAECEAGDRQQAYKACTAALEEFTKRQTGGQVEFSNASEAALSVFKFDEAERFLAESTKRAVPDSWGNPYQHLAALYLGEGRIPEAVNALKEGQALRMRRPAWLDQHGQARLDETVAQLLVVVGENERGLQIAERAAARPDRQGVHSGTEAQADAGTAVLLAVARRAEAERLAEDAVTSSFWQGVKLRWKSLLLRVEAWREERKAATVLADETFLVHTIRPYYVGGADLPMWLVPDVVDIVGAGVGRAAIERARAEETFGASPAYFDAFDAEAAFRAHDWGEAFQLAEKALPKVPQAESLVVGRLAAIAAESARRLGDDDRALHHFATALTKDPGVLRRLDIALPCDVDSDGSPLADAAAKMVKRSPRFRVGDGGYKVTLRSGDGGQATLLGPRGEVVASVDVVIPVGSSPEEGARKLVAELHKAAFALKSDLAQADLTSLDGSPTAARADHQVRSLLDALGPSGNGPSRPAAGDPDSAPGHNGP